MITPLTQMERPDQAALTFPPPKCTQADESSAQTYSSSRSVTEDKTSSGSFNIGIEIPIKMVTIGASYKVLSLPVKGRKLMWFEYNRGVGLTHSKHTSSSLRKAKPV